MDRLKDLSKNIDGADNAFSLFKGARSMAFLATNATAPTAIKF
jgi:hypothetical protein